MNPTDPTQTQPSQPPVNNPLSVMQPGEQVICNIKRHPIGIIGIFVGAGFLLLVLAVLAFGVIPHFVTSTSHNQVYAVGGLIFVVAALVCLGFLFIASKVYWGNNWIVTSDSITQVTKVSLFDKQSSQLSLGNLEDVTAVQDGLLAHMFHYGVLRVETAGERSKFVFPYCPDPNSCAQKILNAREQFEQGRRSETNPQTLYRGQSDYQQPPAPGQNSGSQPPQFTPPSNPVDPSDADGVNVNTEG